MLEEDDTKPLLTTPGQTLSLTEAGKRILSDSKTIQIKQEGGSSISPKVIRISLEVVRISLRVIGISPKVIGILPKAVGISPKVI